MLRRFPIVMPLLLVAACATQRRDVEDLTVPTVEPNESADGGAGKAPDASTDSGTTPNDSGSGARDSSSGADSGQSNDSGASADGGGGDGGSGCVTVAPNNLCGLVPQCGCSAGQTCDVTNDVTGATSCTTAGATTRGGKCTGTGGCALGLTCVFGACRPYCATPNQPCPGTGVGSCFQPEYTAGQTTPNRNVCAIACDPRNPGASCGTNGCLWFGGSKEADCRPVGTLQELAFCNAMDQCAQGLICFNNAFWGPQCERWCRLPSAQYPGDCGGFLSCTDVYGANAPVIGGTKLGLCE